MATLVDWQIKNLVNEVNLVQPYNEEQLNPASYDVLLGSQILVERQPDSFLRVWQQIDLERAPYELAPGEFVLASTVETLIIPIDIEGIFCLKSTRGREGYDHALAAYLDCGFRGQVTLELKNANRYTPLTLTAGMRIGQIRFAKLLGEPKQDYSVTGRYNAQIGPTTARP
jgi:dCTP deaminase